MTGQLQKWLIAASFGLMASIIASWDAPAQVPNLSCKALTSHYSSAPLYNEIVEMNSTNIAPADFYDTVACECRLNLRQTIGEAALKAIAATNAGLWAAEPMHHDLAAQEKREADAFLHWMEGRSNRPTMHGIPACAYSRTDQ